MISWLYSFPATPIFLRRELVKDIPVRKHQSVNLSTERWLEVDWINLQVYSVIFYNKQISSNPPWNLNIINVT